MGMMNWHPASKREFVKTIVDSWEYQQGMFAPDAGFLRDCRCEHQQPYTLTEIEVNVNGTVVRGYGFAKVRYPDEYNPTVGANKTEHRAIQNLAEKLWETEMPMEIEIRQL